MAFSPSHTPGPRVKKMLFAKPLPLTEPAPKARNALAMPSERASTKTVLLWNSTRSSGGPAGSPLHSCRAPESARPPSRSLTL